MLELSGGVPFNALQYARANLDGGDSERTSFFDGIITNAWAGGVLKKPGNAPNYAIVMLAAIKKLGRLDEFRDFVAERYRDPTTFDISREEFQETKKLLGLE